MVRPLMQRSAPGTAHAVPTWPIGAPLDCILEIDDTAEDETLIRALLVERGMHPFTPEVKP